MPPGAPEPRMYPRSGYFLVLNIRIVSKNCVDYRTRANKWRSRKGPLLIIGRRKFGFNLSTPEGSNQREGNGFRAHLLNPFLGATFTFSDMW